MTSEKQIEANRSNAQKSTGPTTTTGIAVARMNALKHGLTARDMIILGEQQEQFDALLQQLTEEFDPVGAIELRLVEQVAFGLWRLRRARRVEAGIFAYNQHETEYQDATDDAESNEEHMLGDLVVKRVVDEDAHSVAQAKAKAARANQNENSAKLGRIFIKDLENHDALGKLSRYETGIERSFYRAFHELQRLQAARMAGTAVVPAVLDVNVDISSPSSSAND